MIIYRNTKTGRFAKRSAWKRSKAHGGTRFKRQSVTKRAKITQAEREAAIAEEEREEEIQGGFDSP